jgi:hypothetical protein
VSELPELDEMLAPSRCFMHLDDELSAFERARGVVLPVPFDATWNSTTPNCAARPAMSASTRCGRSSR